MTLRLRQVGLDDWQFLYDLLEERPAEANISHQAMPDFASHREFIRSDPYKAWYIICLHEDNAAIVQPVGAVYLSKADEIGIAIKKEHHRKGYARTALELLMAQHRLTRYLANIAPNNWPSAKLFMELGFRPIQQTFELKP